MDKLLMILIKHKEFFFPSIAQKRITLLQRYVTLLPLLRINGHSFRLDLLLQGSSPEQAGILSAVDFRKKKHTLMQGPPVPPKPYEPYKKKKHLSKDDSFKMEEVKNNFKRCETGKRSFNTVYSMYNGHINNRQLG